jgi:hypothetical protein
MIRINGPSEMGDWLISKKWKCEFFEFEHEIIVIDDVIFCAGDEIPGVFAIAGNLQPGQTFGAGHIAQK